ncbi:MAG TPA: sugar phosphate nucleotidyltransferase [Candidatus Eisenbacteria bacterium]
MPDTSHAWVILLAAGEGSRVSGVFRDTDGVAIPKQYWTLFGKQTMLGRTIERAARLVPPSRMVPVVAARHARWWRGGLSDIPCWNFVIQPENRGTAIGILVPLLRILRRDRDASVIIMPTDHDFRNEQVLGRSLARALEAVRLAPEHPVLLGMTPWASDPELGYITPGPGAEVIRTIRNFTEKPRPGLAQRLREDGALWNSFIIVANGARLRRAFQATLHGVVDRFEETSALLFGSSRILSRLYARLPIRDFSRDVLQPVAANCRVLTVPECGWTDLGTRARLGAWQHEHDEGSRRLDATVTPQFLTAGQPTEAASSPCSR